MVDAHYKPYYIFHFPPPPTHTPENKNPDPPVYSKTTELTRRIILKHHWKLGVHYSFEYGEFPASTNHQ